jgi:hypothetical protein
LSAPDRERWTGRLALAALYLAGALHWALFLSPPREPLRGPAFVVEDWPKERLYLTVLQQAVSEVRVPLYVSRPIHTRKFMALPEVPWSPQLVLLRVVDPGGFVVLHVLLLHTAGFAGCLLLRRRYALSLVPFSFLYLLLHFNGHLTAHLAVGHSMWAGHLLLPLFLAALFALVETRGGAAARGLALVLFAVVLQGGFHLFVWCLTALLLAAAFGRGLRRAALAAAGWSLALAACRLVPAAFLMNRKEQEFVSGFPSLRELALGLLAIRGAGEPHAGGAFGALGWWEYDTYVGAAALAWLVVFGLVRARGSGSPAGHAALDAPVALLALLALGDLYAPLNASGIPLLAAERVSSRFLILSVAIVGVRAALAMQRWLDAGPRRPARLAWTAALLATAIALGAHSREWRVPHLERSLQPRRAHPAIEIVEQPEALRGEREAAYEASVPLAAAFSILALAALGWRHARRRRSRAAPA